MSSKNKRNDEEILQDIIALIQEIEWHVAIPMDEETEDGKVHGMVIGNDYFIAEILKGYNYEHFDLEEDAHGNLSEPTKKGTFH